MNLEWMRDRIHIRDVAYVRNVHFSPRLLLPYLLCLDEEVHTLIVHESQMFGKWQVWKKLARSPDLASINLIWEKMKTRDRTGKFDAYYAVFELSLGEEHFLFFLGLLDDGELDGEFISDSPGTADLRSHQRWKRDMITFVAKNVTGSSGDLSKILTQASREYTRIRRYADTYQEQLVPIVATNPYIDLRFLTEIRSNARVRVRPNTKLNWNIEVAIEDATVIATVRIYSSLSGYYCELRVLSPRLAIGRNTNFGGRVVGYGIMKASTSKTIPDLISAILSALEDEVPLRCSSYDYTDEEYEASISTSNLPSINEGEFAIYPTTSLRDSSSVMLSFSTYSRLIGEQEILWLKLSNSRLEKEVWVMAHPSPNLIRDNDVYVPDVMLANLCCNPGDKLLVSRGKLPDVDQQGIKIRLRSDSSYINQVLSYIEKMSSLCAGATYSLPVSVQGPSCSEDRTTVYFDVLRAGSRGACSLRLWHADINLEQGEALISEQAPEPVEEELDPLAPEYASDEEED